MANLVLLSLAVFVAVVAAQNQEQCHVYYGGLVFPEGSRRTVEHGLHWSKTQSFQCCQRLDTANRRAVLCFTRVLEKVEGSNEQIVSKPAPDWNGTAVINGEFKEMKLSDFKGKYLVFFFYPLDFTFVCPTEILAFSDRVGEFKAINTEVVACSVDSKYTHFAWINTPREEGGLKGLQIPLLSDLTKQISKDYGVLLENEGHTLRGLFIIDSKGILRQITMNDLPVGRSVDETLRLVQAFQYTDQKGEVCPAGWKPGEKTIKPDPVGKREYFEAAFCEDNQTKP